ncbi:hypothetical protein C8034_v007294 [Colletotrichum sidae]|uniref:Uncharacterized protein n=1 Tax=Colletotrichum sidae TaxID=1347389 RepID=A0A4R8T3V1_9PEZI|nr:hypothetical protein C8034_v007294 [Colletotrichum sidae]
MKIPASLWAAAIIDAKAIPEDPSANAILERFPTALPSYCIVGAAFSVERVFDKLAMDNGPARAPSRPHRAPRVYS